MKLVFFGLSIASAWGSGHATTYRGLVRELHRRGHEVVFYERRAEWFDSNCDLPGADYCDIRRYQMWPPQGVEEAVREADVVVVGSYAMDGIAIIDWLPAHTNALLAYYDIDTPITLEQLRAQGHTSYMEARQLAQLDVVFSFAGGPALDALRALGAQRAEPLYCAVDPASHYPAAPDARYTGQLGYMGTYAAERQDMVDELFLAPARQRPEMRFVLGGPQYPPLDWPPNVTRYGHVAPPDHATFFSSCAWQLNTTRAPMRRLGWSPSVRVFEVVACGAPLISDRWEGFEEILIPGREALIAVTRDDVLAALDMPEGERQAIAAAGRERVLRSHTYTQRVDQMEGTLASLGVSRVRAARAREETLAA